MISTKFILIPTSSLNFWISHPKKATKAGGKYVLKVNTISRTEPAELNQELFDRVFGKDAVKNEEEFIAKIKETISENYKRETDHFLEHHIEDHFIANTSINLPDDFLKTWLKMSSKGQVTDSVLEKEFEEYKRGLKWDLSKESHRRGQQDHGRSRRSESEGQRHDYFTIWRTGFCCPDQ